MKNVLISEKDKDGSEIDYKGRNEGEMYKVSLQTEGDQSDVSPPSHQ